MNPPITTPATIVAGRYRLGAVIDRDGDVRTHRAYDEVLSRSVALSVFPGVAHGVRTDPARSHRWRAARILAGLTHPALVPVYDAGADEQHGEVRDFVVTPLLDGPGLAARIEAGTISLSGLLTTGAALAGALACVHRAGLTHRGLTPRSIRCDADGAPYLQEFALAAATEASAVTADVIDPTGGAYLAPEQVTGDAVGAPVDIYALGLILLECATGHAEYPSPIGRLASAARARLHRPPVIPPTMPHALQRLLAAMTAREPEGRPDAEQVVDELRRIEHSVSSGAPDPIGAPHPAASEDALPSVEEPLRAGAPSDPEPAAGTDPPVEETAGTDERPDGALTTSPSALDHDHDHGPEPEATRRSPGWRVVGLLAGVALLLGVVGGFLGAGRAPATAPPTPVAPAGPVALYGRVDAVLDPGTVVIEAAGRPVTVAVLGVDTDAIPPCARAGALDFAHRTLDGQNVTVVPDPTVTPAPGTRDPGAATGPAYLVLASQLSYTDAAIQAGWATPGDTPALYRPVFDREARQAFAAGAGRWGPACR